MRLLCKALTFAVRTVRYRTRTGYGNDEFVTVPRLTRPNGVRTVPVPVRYVAVPVRRTGWIGTPYRTESTVPVSKKLMKMSRVKPLMKFDENVNENWHFHDHWILYEFSSIVKGHAHIFDEISPKSYFFLSIHAFFKSLSRLDLRNVDEISSKWYEFSSKLMKVHTILKKFHQNLWKFRYLTLGGGSSSQPTPRPPPKINYSMFINSNHLLLVWIFCCEIDDFWWNSMKSHQFLNLTAVWHRGNVGRPRRARTQNWHICAFWLSEFPQLLQKWWKIIKLMIFRRISYVFVNLLNPKVTK